MSLSTEMSVCVSEILDKCSVVRKMASWYPSVFITFLFLEYSILNESYLRRKGLISVSRGVHCGRESSAVGSQSRKLSDRMATIHKKQRVNKK